MFLLYYEGRYGARLQVMCHAEGEDFLVFKKRNPPLKGGETAGDFG